jgi:hypothetical protein
VACHADHGLALGDLAAGGALEYAVLMIGGSGSSMRTVAMACTASSRHWGAVSNDLSGERGQTYRLARAVAVGQSCARQIHQR